MIGSRNYYYLRRSVRLYMYPFYLFVLLIWAMIMGFLYVGYDAYTPIHLITKAFKYLSSFIIFFVIIRGVLYYVEKFENYIMNAFSLDKDEFNEMMKLDL